MQMTHFVVQDAIVPSLTATTREDVIRELIQSLHATGQFLNTDLEDIVKAVLRREQLGSTGIGRTIAIPHSRHSSVSQLIGAVGISKTDRKSTRLNSSHGKLSRMPSSA